MRTHNKIFHLSKSKTNANNINCNRYGISSTLPTIHKCELRNRSVIVNASFNEWNSPSANVSAHELVLKIYRKAYSFFYKFKLLFKPLQNYKWKLEYSRHLYELHWIRLLSKKLMLLSFWFKIILSQLLKMRHFNTVKIKKNTKKSLINDQ